MHKSRSLSWAGLDGSPSLATANITFVDDRLSANGTLRCEDYTCEWTLETVRGWVTRRLTASVQGEGWFRELDLHRCDDGIWSSSTRSDGAPDLPQPGIEDPALLAEALDCDLGLSPATNTMPILRLDLLTSDKAPADETQLTMAWIDLPSLQVLPSTQVYTPVRALKPDRDAVVLYSSGNRGFAAELTVDEDGLVVDYPGLARRVRQANS